MRGRGEQGKKEEGSGSNRCQFSPPKSSACCHAAITVRWVSRGTQTKGKNKVRLGKTKQKYKLRNLKEEKCQGIKADNHQIKV